MLIDVIGSTSNNVPAITLTQFYGPSRPFVIYHSLSRMNQQTLLLSGFSPSLRYPSSTTSFHVDLGEIEVLSTASTPTTTVKFEVRLYYLVYCTVIYLYRMT